MYPFDRVASRFLLSINVVLMATVSCCADDAWPAFRGPSGDGTSDAADPPREWSQQKNISWRTELPGEGWSSPVVGGGRVYVTAAIPRGEATDAEDHDLCVLVLDESTGELLDKIVVMRQTADKPTRVHKKNSHASPTAILSGDRIYVHFGYQGTACLSRGGKVLWTNRDLYFNPTHGNGGSPILVEDRLVFTCDGDKQPRVVALDTDTGSLVWQTPRPVSAKKTFSFCTPTSISVDGRRQIIAPGSNCVLALDPKTGETIWDVRFDGYSVIPKPLLHHGWVYISTGFDRASMLAIRPDGRGIVTDTHVQWKLDKNIPKTPSMVAYQEHVYSVSDDGIMLCVDAATGEVVYRSRLGGNFSASPLLIGDRLYFTDEQGVTTVARAGGEAAEILAENDLGERTLASAAVSGNAIFMRTADALYRIENR
jgi:outer membrane protein assembly factor BamB